MKVALGVTGCIAAYKAAELLRTDGYYDEAFLAQRYMLPMLLGNTWNDVWGDADLAGASVLDYYCPDKPGQNYGFGAGPVAAAAVVPEPSSIALLATGGGLALAWAWRRRRAA